MAEGSQEWRIVKELVPLQGKDVALQKHTASFFVGTPLEQLLRNRGIEAIILCGLATETGIEGTARHASQLGFYPVIVEEAVGSRKQDASNVRSSTDRRDGPQAQTALSTGKFCGRLYLVGPTIRASSRPSRNAYFFVCKSKLRSNRRRMIT
jgi:nicotinamidase-related amidase